MSAIRNYQDRRAADKVLTALLRISTGLNHRLSVEQSETVSDNDRRRGVGEHCIKCDTRVQSFALRRLNEAITEAEVIVLAEALRDYQPGHPLLDQWNLQPENIPKRGKWDFTDSDFCQS